MNKKNKELEMQEQIIQQQVKMSDIPFIQMFTNHLQNSPDWSGTTVSWQENWTLTKIGMLFIFEESDTTEPTVADLFQQLLNANRKTLIKNYKAQHPEQPHVLVVGEGNLGSQGYSGLFERKCEHEGVHHAILTVNKHKANKESRVRTVLHELAHAMDWYFGINSWDANIDDDYCEEQVDKVMIPAVKNYAEGTMGENGLKQALVSAVKANMNAYCECVNEEFVTEMMQGFFAQQYPQFGYDEAQWLAHNGNQTLAVYLKTLKGLLTSKQIQRMYMEIAQELFEGTDYVHECRREGRRSKVLKG